MRGGGVAVDVAPWSMLTVMSTSSSGYFAGRCALGTGASMAATCPICVPATSTGAPGFTPAALSKKIWKRSSGLKNPGADSSRITASKTPTVETTSRPVVISLRSNFMSRY